MKFSNYGFIMLDPSYTKEQKAELKTDDFLTTVYCVGSIEMACESAKKLAEIDVNLIELCGAFKDEMVTKVIESIEGKVPVGNMGMRPEERKKFVQFLKK